MIIKISCDTLIVQKVNQNFYIPLLSALIYLSTASVGLGEHLFVAGRYIEKCRCRRNVRLRDSMISSFLGERDQIHVDSVERLVLSILRDYRHSIFEMKRLFERRSLYEAAATMENRSKCSEGVTQKQKPGGMCGQLFAPYVCSCKVITSLTSWKTASSRLSLNQCCSTMEKLLDGTFGSGRLPRLNYQDWAGLTLPSVILRQRRLKMTDHVLRTKWYCSKPLQDVLFLDIDPTGSESQRSLVKLIKSWT